MRIIISIILLSHIFLSEDINAQQISDKIYTKEIIHEDFNQIGNIFKITTTTDNYFILDNGDYLLSRNNNKSEYAIIANNSFSNNFILKTSLRIGPSVNTQASIGIILKAQENGDGAIIFEINTRGEYRIKQLKGSSYHQISGDKKNNGWVRNSSINTVDNNNMVEIRTENNIFDIHINNNYLTNFIIPDYDYGYTGLIITASTKARVSYFYLNEKQQLSDENLSHNKTKDSISEEYKNTNTVKDNTDLRNNLADNQILINSLKKENEKLKIDVSNNITQKSNLEKENKELKRDNQELSSRISTQEREIETLNNNLKKNNSNEIAITQQLNNQITELKKQLSAENKITEGLNKQISELRAQISDEKERNNIQEIHKKKINTSNSTLINQLKSEITSLKEKIKTIEKTELDLSNLNNELALAKEDLKILTETNTELKELFILKEFERNEVDKSKLITKTTTKKSVNKKQKEVKDTDPIYAIQIGVYTNAPSDEKLLKIKELWRKTTTYGTYIYLSGRFKSPQEATAHKNQIIKLGYPNAFVIKTN